MVTAPAALAKTYVADPRIGDTTASSPCTSPCALRQAVADAQAEEELNFGPVENTIELAPGTYTLTDGPLRVHHPFTGTEEHTTTLVGEGGHASEVVITADGASRVLIDGNVGETSGPVVLQRVEITGGNGDGGSDELGQGPGGGIAVEQNGHLTLKEDLVTANTATEGGGVEVVGALTVEDSTIANNTVTGGEGTGGGISSDHVGGNEEFVKVINSTIVDNTVSAGTKNEGGGIFNGTTLELENSTVAGNSAGANGGGGLASLQGAGVGESTLTDNILAYNTGGDCAGTVPTSLGGNVADDASCALKATGDKQSTDPLLVKANGGPKLAANGGATATVELEEVSRAIGAGSHCPAVDQRGYLRKEPCTAGAYEYAAGEPGSSFVVSGSSSPSTDGTVRAAAISTPGFHAVCSGAECTVGRGAEVTLEATANSGYAFKGWSGAACLTQQSSCHLPNVSEGHTVTANFGLRYKITGVSDPAELSVTATDSNPSSSCSGGACEATEGDTVELTVQQTANVQLREWASGPCKGTAVNPCVITDVSRSAEVTASVELGPPPAPATGTIALYVSSEVGNDNNAGTSPSAPLRTLGQAISIASSYFEHEPGAQRVSQILVGEGEYGENLTIGRFEDVAIYGDLNASDWKPVANPENPTVILGETQGMLIEGSRNILLQQLQIESYRARGAGGSAYGVRMLGSSVTLADVTVRAGDGEAGATGTKGAEGAAGGAGEEGRRGVTPGGTLEFYGFSAGGSGGSGGASPNGNRNATVVEQYINAAYRPPGANPSDPSPGDGGFGGTGYDKAWPTYNQDGIDGPAARYSCSPYQGSPVYNAGCGLTDSAGKAGPEEIFLAAATYAGEPGSNPAGIGGGPAKGGSGGGAGAYRSNWCCNLGGNGGPGTGGRSRRRQPNPRRERVLHGSQSRRIV